MTHRIARGFAAGWIVAALALAWSGAARAGELAPEQKRQFLDAICADGERAERCLAAGHLVENRSVAWIIFEACSASGPREVIVRCFDKAHLLAAELTEDPQHAETHRHCNRFTGENVDEVKMLCYRAGFKYVRAYSALRERFERGEGRQEPRPEAR